MSRSIAQRIAGAGWTGLNADLDAQGWALLPGVLSVRECAAASRLFAHDEHFRRHIVMQQHGYGRGEYKYFSYPLPDVVSELRGALYPKLAPVANRWHEAMRIGVRFPERHEEFLEICHAAGQTRPTPLLLRYGPGDFNCLHQDLYGDHVFPLQVAFLLSRPAEDFTGGEFVLTEQRPRMQSRATVVPLERGDGVIFAVRNRPAQGTRGMFRVMMRHGVSPLRSGSRYTLGIIFHDAA